MENVTKIRSNIQATMDEFDAGYGDLRDFYERLWLVPVGNQIYANNGDAIEFDIRKEETLKLSSNITEYTTEKNNYAMTNISLTAPTITLTGLIGEKVIKADRKNKVQKFLEERLAPLDNFGLGEYTEKTKEYLKKAQELQNKLDETIDKIGSAFSYAKNFAKTDRETKQMSISKLLMGLWETRQVLNVETDFIRLDNMVIQDLEIKNSELTKQQIEVSITLKRLQYFQVVVQKRQSKTASNRKASSKNGKTTGSKSSAKKGLDYYRS